VLKARASCTTSAEDSWLTKVSWIQGELGLSSDLDPIQRWKPDVEDNQVRSQFFGFLNRF
jgi:hypothetical protein